MGRLLDGIRVIDAANFIAGPVSTTVMADFGAEVIKVEPPSGDVYRVRGAGYPPSAYNYPWIVDNRSKRSVAIDLRTADGQALLHRLVRDVDVFVTNAPLDSRARLRVRYEDLAPINARLIYASISAYGETGDEASKPGLRQHRAVGAHGADGSRAAVAGRAAPSRSLPGMGDHPTGMSLFAAIMAGLYHRERTGRGTAVSTSLMANGLWMNAIQVQGILCGTRTEVRPPREDAVSALANLYRCRDGRWFMLTITGDERHWHGFAKGIGREDLVTDPRFVDAPSRKKNARALTADPRPAFRHEGLGGVVADPRQDRRRVRRRGHARRHPARRADARERRAGADRRSARRRVAHGRRARSRSPTRRRCPPRSRPPSASTPWRCCARPASRRRDRAAARGGRRSSSCGESAHGRPVADGSHVPTHHARARRHRNRAALRRACARARHVDRRGPPALHDVMRAYPIGWLHPETDYIASFPPLNNLPTQYRVTVRGEQRWFAQCGFEATSVTWLFPGETVRVDAPCLDCGDPVTLEMRDGRITWVDPPGVVGHLNYGFGASRGRTSFSERA